MISGYPLPTGNSEEPDGLKDRDSVNEVLVSKQDRALLFQRFHNYKSFIKEYMDEKVLTFDDTQYYYVRTFKKANKIISIFGLNSAWLSASNEDKGRLLIGEKQVRSALKEVKDADLRLAVMHHPFDWLKDFDRKDVDPLLCGACDFILHGHLHQSQWSQVSTPDTNAIIIAAGACYETREYPNSYNFVQLDISSGKGKIFLRTYSDNGGGFWTKDTATYKNAENGLYSFDLPPHLNPKVSTEISKKHPTKLRSEHIEIESYGIPLPQNPYFAHPYPPPTNFTGRKSELDMLTNWLNNDKRQILVLVAMGGMGKSFLSWQWLQNDVDFISLDGVLWWSFYEDELSFSKFLDDAIIYTSGRRVDPSPISSDYDKTQILVNFLRNSQFLIILDGFERLLRNYDSKIAEDENIENFDDLNSFGRACTDHNAARFLRYLADGNSKSKILITTRLMIHDLEDQANNPLKDCYKRELKSLNPDDAVTFMRLQGVIKGTPNEIRKACAYYDFHPLSLRLLSGLIVQDKKHPGDINTAPRHNIDANLTARRHHILEVAYKSLPYDWQILLSKASAFRSSIIYDALLSISDEYPNENEFETALDGLMDRGLLLFDKDKARFDLHPIVRRYAYDRLIDKIGVHTNLKEYFTQIPSPDKVQSLKDLTSTIELCYHAAKAGLYEEAYNIYKFKLSERLFYIFGAYQVCIELLSLFYSDRVNNLHKLDKTHQGWILNELAINYRLSGQQRLAVSIINTALPLVDELKEKNNMSIGFLNLSESQLRLGELEKSASSLKKSLEYFDEFEKELDRSTEQKNIDDILFDKAVIHNTLGQIFIYMGSFNKAAQELNLAYNLESRRFRIHNKYAKSVTTPLISRIYSQRIFRILLMRPKVKQLKASVAASKKAKKMANEGDGNFDKIVAKLMVGLSQTRLASIDMNNRDKILSEAESDLKEALELCRRTDLVELEPDILLAWARWHHVKNDNYQALKDAEEALYIADRFEYRLKQAEIHNFMAQLALDSGDAGIAKQHAEIAQERAWCDGPPYCYKPALDDAKEIFIKLGVEPPEVD